MGYTESTMAAKEHNARNLILTALPLALFSLGPVGMVLGFIGTLAMAYLGGTGKLNEWLDGVQSPTVSPEVKGGGQETGGKGNGKGNAEGQETGEDKSGGDHSKGGEPSKGTTPWDVVTYPVENPGTVLGALVTLPTTGGIAGGAWEAFRALRGVKNPNLTASQQSTAVKQIWNGTVSGFKAPLQWINPKAYYDYWSGNRKARHNALDASTHGSTAAGMDTPRTNPTATRLRMTLNIDHAAEQAGLNRKQTIEFRRQCFEQLGEAPAGAAEAPEAIPQKRLNDAAKNYKKNCDKMPGVQVIVENINKPNAPPAPKPAAPADPAPKSSPDPAKPAPPPKGGPPPVDTPHPKYTLGHGRQGSPVGRDGGRPDVVGTNEHGEPIRRTMRTPPKSRPSTAPKPAPAPASVPAAPVPAQPAATPPAPAVPVATVPESVPSGTPPATSETKAASTAKRTGLPKPGGAGVATNTIAGLAGAKGTWDAYQQGDGTGMALGATTTIVGAGGTAAEIAAIRGSTSALTNTARTIANKAALPLAVATVFYDAAKEKGTCAEDQLQYQGIRFVGGAATAGTGIGMGVLATGAGVAATVAAPLVAAVAVGMAADHMIETSKQYAVEDRRFAASQDNRHIESAKYRILNLSEDENEVMRRRYKLLGAKFNDNDQFDLNDTHTRQVVREELVRKKWELVQAMEDNEVLWMSPRYNPFASKEKTDRYNNARSDLAIIKAASIELGEYEENRQAMLLKRAKEAYRTQTERLADVRGLSGEERQEFLDKSFHRAQHEDKRSWGAATEELAEQTRSESAALKAVLDRLPRAADGSLPLAAYAHQQGEKKDMFDQESLQRLKSDLKAVSDLAEKTSHPGVKALRDEMNKMSQSAEALLAAAAAPSTERAAPSPGSPSPTPTVPSQEKPQPKL